MLFPSLDLNNPRVSKHSRHVELSRRKRPWRRVSHSFFRPQPGAQTNRTLSPARAPLTTVGAAGKQAQPCVRGTEASRLKGSNHRRFQALPREMEPLKSSWQPRAGRVAQWAAMGPQRSGCRGLGHDTNLRPQTCHAMESLAALAVPDTHTFTMTCSLDSRPGLPPCGSLSTGC